MKAVISFTQLALERYALNRERWHGPGASTLSIRQR